jgi:hypothetical protein
MLTTRKRLSDLAQVVGRIEMQQEYNPGYSQDILEAIVNTELRRLEEETERAEVERWRS